MEGEIRIITHNTCNILNIKNYTTAKKKITKRPNVLQVIHPRHCPSLYVWYHFYPYSVAMKQVVVAKVQEWEPVYYYHLMNIQNCIS